DIGSGEKEAGAGHHARIGNSPGVGVKHGSEGHDRVVVVEAKCVRQTFRKGVKHEGAMGVDDALGKSGSAGSEAHHRAVVFVDGRIGKIRIGLREQLFVIQIAFGDLRGGVGNNDHFFKGGVVAELLEHGQKNIVDDEKTVSRVAGDSGNFVRMEAKIQGMQNGAGARHAKKGFQVDGVIPHHGGDTVAAAQAELRKRAGEPASAVAEARIGSIVHGAIRAARENLDFGKMTASTFEKMRKGQGIFHHRSAQKYLVGGNRLAAWYHQRQQRAENKG